MSQPDPAILECSAELTRARQQCIFAIHEQRASGDICTHPTDTNTWRADKKGWYDTTSSGQKNNVAKKAKAGESRVYCPPLCNQVQYTPNFVTQSRIMSDPAALAIAHDLITTRQVDNMHVPGIDVRKCGLNCAQQLATYVKESMVVVNIVYEKLEEEVITVSPAVSISSLFGSIGGNLGLFVGASVMTMLEFVECLFIAVASGVIFRCGKKYTKSQKEKQSSDGGGGGGGGGPGLTQTGPGQIQMSNPAPASFANNHSWLLPQPAPALPQAYTAATTTSGFAAPMEVDHASLQANAWHQAPAMAMVRSIFVRRNSHARMCVCAFLLVVAIDGEFDARAGMFVSMILIVLDAPCAAGPEHSKQYLFVVSVDVLFASPAAAAFWHSSSRCL